MVGRNFHHQQEKNVHYSGHLRDQRDEDINGRFYEPELQLIIKDDNVYDVEKC